jgi:DNA-directed RNA polymerase specialized sigma24 family protein
VGDSGRAEELAAEVFWKLSRTPKAQGANSSGWLYRTATRMALDELRKQLRRKRYEGLFSPGNQVERRRNFISKRKNRVVFDKSSQD